MELSKNAINLYSSKVDGLGQYLLILNEIEDNKVMNPDISIDGCKSFIEGLCKKALSLNCEDYKSKKNVRKDCEKFDKLIDYTFKKIFKDVFEEKLLASFSKLIGHKSRTSSILRKSYKITKEYTEESINAVVKYRDTRGDISHGRIYPKIHTTSKHLLESIISITDAICSFLIIEMSNMYLERLELDSKRNELKDYRSNSEYNHWLNESLVNEFPLKKVSYSKLLFEYDFDMYQQIYYDDYYPNLNILESKDKVELGNLVFNLYFALRKNKVQEVKKECQEVLPILEHNSLFETTSDSFIKNSKYATLIKQFSDANNLKEDLLKLLVDEYIFSFNKPLRDELLNLPKNKVKLIDRNMKATELEKLFIEFVRSLKL